MPIATVTRPGALLGRLVAVVESACGWEGLDPTANLINAGLTSLEAARVVVGIGAANIAEVEIADVFEFPTVASLAAEIQRRERASEGSADSTLIRLAEGDGQESVFCVHGGNGRVSFMRPLFQKVCDQTGIGAWGIEAVGLDGLRKPVEGVPAMASRYVEMLKTAQRHGPYRLAGYCAGGEIAIEMAAQLSQRGDEIAFLGIVDPYASDHNEERSDDELRQFRIAELVAHCVSADFARAEVDPTAGGTWESLASSLASIGRLHPSAGPEAIVGHVDVWLNNVRSLERYRRPRDVPGAHLFVASEHPLAPSAVPHGAAVHRFVAQHDYAFESDELAEVFAQALRALAAGGGA